MLVVAFVQPQWLGDTEESPGVGTFGLYRYCSQERSSAPTPSGPLVCRGSLSDFSSVLSVMWRAATFLLGFSVLLYCLVLAAFLLFFCLHSQVVFLLVAWVQLVATICIFLACVLYPAGWDAEEVVAVCGPDTAGFDRGLCQVRWAYILAIVAIFDSLVLCVLAFILACRNTRSLDKYIYHRRGTKAGSTERHSYVRPVMPHSENASVYSIHSGNTAKRSSRGGAFHL